MLRGVCLHLTAAGRTLSVLARGAEGLRRIVVQSEDHRGRVVAIAQDYRDVRSFRERVRESIDRYGPIGLAVTWIRSDAIGTYETVASLLRESPAACFELRGSRWAAPNAGSPPWESAFRGVDGLKYRIVTLGFVVDGDRARWLTHDEISAGVVRAIDEDRDRTIGVFRPWSRRPSTP